MPPDHKHLSSRFAPVIAVVGLLLLASLFPKGTVTSTGDRLAHKGKQRNERAERHSEKNGNKHPRNDRGIDLAADIGGGDGTVDLAAYEDLGSWIDIYDSWPWAHP